MPTATLTPTTSVPTTGRGLKGFLTRNRVTSPEPAEPTKSRFRSFVDEVSGRGTVKQATNGRATPVSEDKPTARSRLVARDARARPCSPDTATRRIRNNNYHLPPAIQKGTDGRWQQPSLSKGSMSTSALARYLDEDDNTARPLDRRGKGGLSDLFGGVAKIERKLSTKNRSPPARPFPLPPPDDLAKKLALDPDFVKNLEEEDRTIRALAAKAAKERKRPSTALDKPHGSRHTSKVELHPTHRVSKALPAVPQMTSADSNDRSSTPAPTSPASEAPSPYTWKRIDCNGSPMPVDHYQLRLAIAVLLKTLTPYIRGPDFATKEKNGEVKRIAADQLAILTRMEKTWNGDWTRAVVAALDRKEEEEDIRLHIKTSDIGDRAKERERTSFTTALSDGVLLCLYFNVLFKIHGQPPPITQINVSQEQAHRNANISRFVSACSKSGIPAERIPLSSDLTAGGARGLSRTISAINGLTKLPRPSEKLGQRAKSPDGTNQRAKSPSGDLSPRAKSPNPTVRFVGSRPPSRVAISSPPISPLTRTRPLASPTPSSSPPSASPPVHTQKVIAKSPSVSPTRAVASPTRINASPQRIVSSPQTSRPTSPVRPQPTSRGMEKSRSADSTNDLQLKLQLTTEAAAEDPERTPTTTPTTSAILQTPVTPSGERRSLLPRQGLARTQTQPNGSPILRPKSPHSPGTSGSITPTHRRPSLRPRNTTGSASTSTRVSFAEEGSSGLADNRPMPLTGFHMKERTPSLVSASTRPSTAYSRSSAAYSNLTVMDNDENSVFVEDGSFGRSGIQARSRRNSEKTLHDARQRIMGTILVPDGMTLRESEEPEGTNADERAAAIQSSLAALEGSPGSNARQSPRRPHGPRRGHSLGVTGQDMQENIGEEGLRGAVTPDARRAYANGRYSVAISPKSMSPNGPSPERSPTKDTIDKGGSPPISRVNSRVSGEYRPILRPRHTSGNAAYAYGYANSNSAVSVVLDPVRNDSRTRLSSIIHNSHSSGRSIELPASSRPVSAITLDIAVDKDIVRYTLSECIGKGQFGSVYKALNNSTGQTVAIKRVSLDGMDDKEAKNVMGEVELLKRLDHPSIVKYMGMNKSSDYLDIILEYVEGGSLGSQLKLCRSFNEPLVAMIVAKILEGLAYLHGEGVIHRDLKAANILSTKTGNIKLTDFGVSLNTNAVENIPQEVRTASVRHGKVNWDDIAGTPNWMAPEVIEMSGACFASDIWSLGCTIVELLTGKPPYADLRESMSVMFRIVKDDMPPLPIGLSGELNDFLQTCFKKDPATRPAAKELFDHVWLKRYCPDLPSLRAQDSIPFLRRVSTNFGRPSLDLGENDRDLQSRRQSHAESTSGRPGMSLEERPETTKSGRSSQDSSKTHNLIATTFAKPIICGVCGLHVRQGALCQDCHLICHEACATEDRTQCAQEHWANYARRLGSSSSSAAVNASTSVVDISAFNVPDLVVQKPSPRPFPVMETSPARRHPKSDSAAKRQPVKDEMASTPVIPTRDSPTYHKLCVDTPSERARRVSQKSNRTSKSGKSNRSNDKENRQRQSSQSRPRNLSQSDRKKEELKEVIMMANAIDTIRQKGRAKAKEAKSECRIM